MPYLREDVAARTKKEGTFSCAPVSDIKPDNRSRSVVAACLL